MTRSLVWSEPCTGRRFDATSCAPFATLCWLTPQQRAGQCANVARSACTRIARGSADETAAGDEILYIAIRHFAAHAVQRARRHRPNGQAATAHVRCGAEGHMRREQLTEKILDV